MIFALRAASSKKSSDCQYEEIELPLSEQAQPSDSAEIGQPDNIDNGNNRYQSIDLGQTAGQQPSVYTTLNNVSDVETVYVNV